MLNKQMLLARVAGREAELSLNARQTGEANLQIDKYLSLIFQLFNSGQNGGEARFQPKQFSWDCLFVYYCCHEAGFSIPLSPFADERTLLNSANDWQTWASFVNNLFWHPLDEEGFNPRMGDLVIFDQLLQSGYRDHLGIILSFTSGNEFMETAEGNIDNTIEHYIRHHKQNVRGYIRLESI